MATRITITDTAYRGSGVGRTPDGKAVFVPYTVTGDVITAEIMEDKGSYSNGRLLEIIEPSIHRTVPHCPHHGICGGCHFGHISYPYQLEIKKNILQQALRKHPQYESLSNIEIISAQPLDYRIRATVRTLNGKAGFYKGGTNEFIAVEHCPVMKSSLYDKCSAWAKQYNGAMQALSVIETPTGEAIALAGGAKSLYLGELDGISDGLTSVGKDYLLYETFAGSVPVGYGGFFQSNSFLNDAFQTHAVEGVRGRVLELYAGSGFFTVALMKKAHVEGLELNKTAALLAQREGIPVKTADVAVIGGTKTKYDAVFMDPPREGVDKKTLSAVQMMNPPEVIYVSCNPMTLARDIIKLSDNYRIKEITLFDMFPYTFHIEAVVKLERQPAS